MPEDFLDKESPRISEPMGERIIGLIDPRTMTKEEFDSSSELLFHGSEKPFVFSREEKYDTLRPGSSTLGNGFYTTNNRKEAEFYSKVRRGAGRNEQSEVYLTAVLPYQARMLDLRQRGNLLLNAPVPSDFARKWYDFYKKFYERLHPTGSPWPQDRKELQMLAAYGEYHSFLNKLFKANSSPSIDLRKLLRGEVSEEIVAHPFSLFMTELGYDGLIYVEGGDRATEAKECASYVFYNLEKIGDYDLWHKQQPVKEKP